MISKHQAEPQPDEYNRQIEHYKNVVCLFKSKQGGWREWKLYKLREKYIKGKP